KRVVWSVGIRVSALFSFQYGQFYPVILDRQYRLAYTHQLSAHSWTSKSWNRRISTDQLFCRIRTRRRVFLTPSRALSWSGIASMLQWSLTAALARCSALK